MTDHPILETTFPRNVVNSIGEPLVAEVEALFLSRVIAALHAKIPDQFQRLTFVVHRWRFHERKGAEIILRPGDKNSVLILLSDEREVFPVEDYPEYLAVFRAYGNQADPLKAGYPFPVGYLNAAGSTDSLPFEGRSTQLFFSGYLNRNRVDVYKQFRPVGWLPQRNLRSRYTKELARRAVERFCRERTFNHAFPSSSITFTEWFGKGLEPSVYAKTLANSKIALCPPGFVTSETIRHWEAMRLGCVIISAPLPQNRFYKGSPIIELQDWSELKPLLTHLLANPDELHLRHEGTVKWWNRMCSENAVADYMADILR